MVKKMRRLARSRKGVSLVMGTLLLVIVTMVAGILFYNMIMGSVFSMTNNFNTQMSTLLIDASKVNATCITAFIRNTGQSTVEILNAYVNDEIATLTQTVKIAASSLAITYIQSNYNEGTTYSVKLAGMFGTLVTFQVKYD